MPDEMNQMAGTPVPTDAAGDDAQRALAESGRVEGRDGGDAGEQASEPDWKALYLQSKSKVEEANRLLKEREQEPVAATMPPTASPQELYAQQQVAQLGRLIEEARLDAQAGDYKAQLLLMSLEAQQQQYRNVVNEMSFSRIPADEQALARKEFATGMYATPEAALLAVRGRRWESDRTELEKRKAELDAQAAARQRGVETHTRGVTAREHAQHMESAKWLAEVRRAKAEGNRERLTELYRMEDEGRVA